MPSRRGFLGGLMLGSAALAAKAMPSAEVIKLPEEKELIVPDGAMADSILKAGEGDALSVIPMDQNQSVADYVQGTASWFGVPFPMIQAMSEAKQAAWLGQHHALNRSFGLSGHPSKLAGNSEEFKSFYPGGEYY